MRRRFAFLDLPPRAPMPEPDGTLDEIETPVWGKERREPTLPRRDEDRKLYGFLLTVVVTAFSIGVAWATTTAMVHQKVDKSDQAVIDSRQDAQLAAILSVVRDLKIGVDSANLRLRQIACAGQPVSCR